MTRKKTNEPKRHIVLTGKRNIVGIEDKSDVSENYEKDERIPPFCVAKDPSILLAAEDTPWLWNHHNQWHYVKKSLPLCLLDIGSEIKLIMCI
jgi:hypothetical protein